MDASIGVTADVKKTLESVKPAWMTWSELLETIFLVSNKEKLQAAIDGVFERAEGAAVEEAKARYHKYRKNPQGLLSAGELKQRIQTRRLKQRFILLNEIMSAKPEGDLMASPHFLSLLASADEDIHAFREWMVAKQPREDHEKVA